MENKYELGVIKLFTEDQIEEKMNSMTYDKAPLLIHQRFCHELVSIMKKQPNEVIKDVPEAMEVLTAIRVLEGIYPELKDK